MSYSKVGLYARFRERSSGEPVNTYHGVSGFDFMGQRYSFPWDQAYRVLEPFSRERCFDTLHPGPPYLSGGPFNLFRSKADSQLLGGGRYQCVANPLPGQILHWYEGSFSLLWPSIGDLTDASMKDIGQDSSPYNGDYADSSQYGPASWNRFRPKTSSADLGVAIAEMRDLPKMLKKTAEGFHYIWKAMGGNRTGFNPKRAADQFLNTQFGWRPFVKDLRDALDTAKDFNLKLAQLRNHNGRWLKRSGSYHRTHTSSVIKSGNGSILFPAIASDIYVNPNGPFVAYNVTHDVSDHVWFEGRFRYWIPELDQDTPYARTANFLRQYGMRVSPSLVWEATPWSWLIDWFTNAGDVVDNFTAQAYDHLASKYAFVMRHRYESVTCSGEAYLKPSSLSFSQSRIIETKKREAASPFGFGLEESSFTPFQWSILAALGLSRRR